MIYRKFFVLATKLEILLRKKVYFGNLFQINYSKILIFNIHFYFRKLLLLCIYGPTLFLLLLFTYLTSARVCSRVYSTTSLNEELGGNIITHSRWMRLTIFIATVILMSICAVITLVC